ncbi:MAG: polymer-forming cytoskeletal protein [Sphingobium sp.]|nr:polymer-forming cytoskeletal protein [Sphingobium sp.]
MFSKSSSSQSNASSVATGARHTPFSILGSDVTIRGDVEARVDLHIDGRVEGDIICAALVQGAESRIKGHVNAKTARIAGTIEGSITTEELIVEGSARISGDVTYQTIAIAAGGQVDGKLTHKDPGTQGDLKLVKS